MNRNRLYVFLLSCFIMGGCSDKSSNPVDNSPHLPVWEQMSGPSSRIFAMAVNGSSIFVGSDSSRIFISHDEGNTWIVRGLDPSLSANRYVSAILVLGSGRMVVGTNGIGGFQTVDNGNVWAAFSSLPDSSVFSFAQTQSAWLAGTFQAIFRSTNQGATWSMVLDSVWARSLAADAQGNFYASINQQGVFRSTSGGVDWSLSKLTYSSPKFYLDRAGHMWFIDYNGAYRTTDAGLNWSNTISFLAAGTCMTMNSQGHMFVGHVMGIRVSFDGGNTWMFSTSDSLSRKAVFELGVSGSDRVFAATDNHGVYRNTIRR